LSDFGPTRRSRGAFSRRLNDLAPRNVAEDQYQEKLCQAAAQNQIGF